MTDEKIISLLKHVGAQGTYTAAVRIMGFVSRGIGIWPEHVTVRINEIERFLLPSDLHGISFSLVIGTDAKNVEIFDWRLIDVTPVTHGATDDNPTNRPLEWDLTLEDGRWRLQGDRGGLLMQGVLNPTLPDGSIVPGLKKTNSELVALCIAAIPMTFREGVLSAPVIAKMNAIEPPAELVWRGAHAPTQLQRLLEWTRCCFAYNQGGTYSIHTLVDPPNVPSNPYIPDVAKLPSSRHTITPPDHEGKCIIASCPTRHLIQRVRTLYQSSPYEPPRPLQWVGVETDGSVHPLTDLSWWPVSKTPLQVFRNKFKDVDDDHRRLAQSCVFRMVRLHDDDLAEDWTLLQRLVDENAAPPSARGEPLGVLVKSNASYQDHLGAWINPTGPVPVEDVRFDLERGVFIFSRPQVRLNLSRSYAPEQEAEELVGAQLSITFGHHPNAGDHTDYFMGVYKWDDGSSQVVKVETPDPETAITDALAEGVPVYRFPDLQLNYIEQAHPSTDIDVQNSAAIEAIALGYAKAMITAQEAVFEVQEYPGLHNLDPDHSSTLIVWDPNNLMTTVHLGRHQPISSDYVARLIDSRSTHGGRAGAPAGAVASGVGRSTAVAAALGALGASSGARDASRVAVNALPGATMQVRRRFWAKILSETTPDVWSFTEVYKSNTGAGSVWTAPSGAVTGSAREFNAARVAANAIVEMFVIDIFKADGTVTFEYWFDSGSGGLCLGSGGCLEFDANGCLVFDLDVNSTVQATVVTGGSLSIVAGTPNKLRLTLTRSIVTFSRNACGVLVGVSAAGTSSVTSDLNLDECT